MSERELFVKLEEKYKELYDMYVPLIEDSKAFEGGDEYEAYHKLTEDEVKKMLYPERYEMYAKISEIEPKIEAFEREIENAGKEFVIKLNEEIQMFEKKIATNKEHIAKIQKDIEAKEQEIATLKETEAYKTGDEETLLKVEDLELDVKAKKLRIEQLEQRISFFEKDLDDAKKEKEHLLEDYPELDEKLQQVEETEQEQPASPEAVDQSDKQGAKDDRQEKTSGSGKRVVADVAAPESKEKQQEEKEDKDPKEEFNKLVAKAKKGTLDDKEFDKLIEIMKNPNSYDEFGITTGIIFNNSKGIFKALAKSLGSTKKISKEIKEIFAEDIVGDLQDKELFEKIASLEKEGLDEKQQSIIDKVKSTLDKQESLRQAKDVRDAIALEKNEKRWSWLIDFSEDKKRLGEAKSEPEEKFKPIANIPGLKEQNKSEDEQNQSYNEPVHPVASRETISHDIK